MGETSYDAVVIGSGVCGAITAWQLALSGANVLILEAGPATADRTALVGNYIKTGSPFHDAQGDQFAPTEDTSPGSYYVFEGHPHFQSTYVRRVGGSTWHFLGNMPRFLPTDFELQTRYGVGVDWPLKYEQLEEHYSTAECWIGVAGDHDEWNHAALGRRSRPFPMSQIWESYSDRVVKRRTAGLKIDGVPVVLRTTPQARNSRPYDGRPACAGNSTCVPICPIQAKYDATVHVEKAIAEGATLRDRSVVDRLEADSAGAAVTRVHYRSWDGNSHSVRGRIVILAAHAIESARILLFSGLANTSDQVGRNLMDHLQGAVVALAPEPLYPFRGPPTTSGIDAFRDGPFRQDHGAFRLSLGNDGWGRGDSIAGQLGKLIDEQRLHGTALHDAVEHRFTRLVRLSYSTEMLPKPENRVELATVRDSLGLPRPKLAFAIDDYSRKAFACAKAVCERIFEAAGATDRQVLIKPEDAVPETDWFAGAGHISGTCRMGTDPSASVVDPSCRSHDHPNLFIIGSSVFPTEGTANPTLTATALTARSLPGMTERIRAMPV
jgi:choline dehydrogenase-like flavoprotein